MSAAFVPAFTRRLANDSRASAWRLGNLVITALTLGTLISVAAAWLLAPALVRTLAPQFAQRTRQARADGASDAHHAAVSGDRRRERSHDGHAQRAASLLHSGAVAGHVQRRHDRRRARDRAVDAARRLASYRRHRRWYTARRSRTDGAAVAGAASRRLAVPTAARLARPRFAGGPASDGAGDTWSGGRAGERVRQHHPRDWSGHRCRVLVELRVSTDVPADRALRHFDRHRGAAGDFAARRQSRRRGTSTDNRGSSSFDAGSQRTGDNRPGRARAARRVAAPRAGPVRSRRHRRHGGSAGLLRSRARRVLRREDRVAQFLRAAGQPHAAP